MAIDNTINVGISMSKLTMDMFHFPYSQFDHFLIRDFSSGLLNEKHDGYHTWRRNCIRFRSTPGF